MDKSNFKNTRVHNPEGKDFEFEGIKLGEITHGEVGTLEVYQTRGGKWVVSQSHNIMRPNLSWFRAAILETPDQVVEWLGSSRPAKKLAEQIGLSVTAWVE